MKTRLGFVSNSSSSSFIINLEDITISQKNLISNHIESAKMFQRNNPDLNFQCVDEGDAWYVYENDNTLEGNCHMDNFDMYSFMEFIGIDLDKVKWNY